MDCYMCWEPITEAVARFESWHETLDGLTPMWFVLCKDCAQIVLAEIQDRRLAVHRIRTFSLPQVDLGPR